MSDTNGTTRTSPMPPPVRQQDPDATPEQVAAALLRRDPAPTAAQATPQ